MTGVKSSFPIEDVYVNMTWTTYARRTSKPAEPLNSYEEIIDKVTYIPFISVYIYLSNIQIVKT